MIEWDAYSSRLYNHGKTHRDRIIEREQRKILGSIHAAPGCHEVLVNDIPQYLFIKRTDAPTKKAINTLPGESINLGSVVFWEDRHWLVTEALRDDNMTYFGAIEQCNRQLTWQNPHTREIISRWCTIAKPYYSNLDTKLATTISSREFKVQLPSDAESNMIDVDWRFMLEIIDGQPKVYRCTSVDMNTKRYDVDGESVGFLVLNIEQCQYDAETDNAELGICDYLEPFNDLVPTSSGWCIIEASDTGVVPGGLPINLYARYFNAQGQPIEDRTTKWSISANPELVEYLKSEDYENGRLRLSLDYYSEFIGEPIEITAINADGTISNTLALKVVNAL